MAKCSGKTGKLLITAILVIQCSGLNNTQDEWTNWCDLICKCDSNDRAMNIGCKNSWFSQAPHTWPQKFVEDKNAQEKTLVVTIHYNQMKKLAQFPEIKARRVAMTIKNCNLEEISYAAFKNIKNIYFLNLAFNKLTGEAIRGDIFKGPYDSNNYEPIDLEVLHLESNLIHSLERRTFEHTPKLRSLYLFNNPIGVLDSVTVLALVSIKTLEVLDLSYTGISYLPDDFIRNSKSLRELRLSGNNFKTVPESLGSIGSSLKFLTFNKNLIEELTDNSFLGLWRLEHLEIGNMETLKRVKSGAFAQLRSLKILHMCHNKNLKEIDHEAFRELKSNWPVKELYLHDNGLETLSEDLVPWDQLYSVNLESNAWICDCKMANSIVTKGVGKKIPQSSVPRCDSPKGMNGVKLTDLNPSTLCSAKENSLIAGQSKYHSMRNLATRPGSAMFALVFVCTVVVLGLLVGCCVSFIRKKLSKLTFAEPIRYTNLIT